MSRRDLRGVQVPAGTGAEQPQLTAWVQGSLRHRRSLHTVLGAVQRRALKKRSDAELAALELGAFRLLFSPPSMAPDEIVTACVDLLDTRRVQDHCRRVLEAVAASIEGRIEAHPGDDRTLPVSRDASVRFQRPLLGVEGRREAARLGILHSLPDALVEAWLAAHGSDGAAELCRAANDPPPLWARVNPLRADREQVRFVLAAEGVSAEPGPLEGSLRLRGGAFRHTRPWREGWLTVQDLTAQRAAALLAPRAHERVLDACAAPGTKATHLAELAGDWARVLAADRDRRRLARVEDAIARLGLTSLATRTADARHASALADAGPFDAVLVDAPCSNTGVLRRRPEARWRYDRRSQRRLARTQTELLTAAVDLLAPGGRLVHSVCAIEPEEGTEQVRRFLEERPELELASEHLHLPEPDGGDGGYQALLRRIG